MGFWDGLKKAAGFALAPVTGGASLLAASQADGLKQDNESWNTRGDPYAGMPELPKDVLNGVTRDTSGLDAYSKEAMRTGPSAWAGMAQEQNRSNEMDAYNRGMGQAASHGQEARDSLAMQGGLTSGAAERSANATSRNMLDVGQDVGRQGDANALQIGINDEQNRISELSALPGMQLQGSSFDLAKAQGQNQFNAQNYATQGSIWGAGKQADSEDPRNPASPNYDDGKRVYNPFTWF